MKSIIITGANSGIGFECALQMAKIATNEQIILACRNIQAGNEASKIIKYKTGHQNIKCLQLDLASLKSIQHFADAFSKEKQPIIKALVNNAGLQNVGETLYTEDGYELTFGTNHLGPFALTQLLMAFLDNNASITFTASDTHDPLQKTGIEPPVYTNANEMAFPKESNEKKTVVGQRRYSTSKLCNVLTTYILQEKLANTTIRVNAFDPGLTPGTGLTRNYPAIVKFVWKNILPVLTLFKHNTNTPSKSGGRLASLAFSKEFSNLKGIYFSDGKVLKSSTDSYNRNFQTDLWNSSLKLTNTNFIEHIK